VAYRGGVAAAAAAGQAAVALAEEGVGAGGGGGDLAEDAVEADTLTVRDRDCPRRFLLTGT
jgi:hypothetical protein